MFWLLNFYRLLGEVHRHSQTLSLLQNGSPRKFYFPFVPSYWIGGIAAKRNVIADGEVGVSTDDVFKIYGENHAVNGVSVRLASGQVTAMLGVSLYQISLFSFGAFGHLLTMHSIAQWSRENDFITHPLL